MFEFESQGTLDELRALETDLCEHLGLGTRDSFHYVEYDALARRYENLDLTAEDETKMAQDFGRVVFLQNFPEHTSPFWNMRRNGTHARKIDVIIDGMETIGSAERSVDTGDMRERFHTISGGEYANLLYEKFGRDRVEQELEAFLSLDFFPRFGGGIGLTRLMRAVA